MKIILVLCYVREDLPFWSVLLPFCICKVVYCLSLNELCALSFSRRLVQILIIILFLFFLQERMFDMIGRAQETLTSSSFALLMGNYVMSTFWSNQLWNERHFANKHSRSAEQTSTKRIFSKKFSIFFHSFVRRK